MGSETFCGKCYEWVGAKHDCTPLDKRPKRTMGLEAGAKPLTDAQVEARLNCFGPGGTGRLLATIETKDAEIARLTDPAKARECDTVCAPWAKERKNGEANEIAFGEMDTAFHVALERIAKAAGIQTGREGWWDNKRDAQVDKIVERVKKLRGAGLDKAAAAKGGRDA